MNRLAVQVRHRTQEQVINRIFLMSWMVAGPTCFSTVATYALNVEFYAIKTECSNSMYALSSYIIAHTIIQIPAMMILSVAAFVPGFLLAEMVAANACPVFFVFAVLLWCFECFAQLISLVPNPLLGILGVIDFWFVSFLFSGQFLRLSDIVWPFRAFTYISPLRYGLSLLVYYDVHDTEHAGSELCVPGRNDTQCMAGGFKCISANNSIDSSQCYGFAGTQVLDTLNMQFTQYMSSTPILRFLVFLLTLSVVTKGLFVATITRAMRLPHLTVTAAVDTQVLSLDNA